jgi:hypothetical protein
VYKSLAAQNEDLQIKVTPSLKGVMNSLQLLELVQENIIRADLIDEKIRRQTDFESWIAADGRRRRQWSTVLDEIARINEEHRQTYERDYLLHCIIHYVRLLDAANTIVRMAEERSLPDDQRELDYQERNWVRLAQSLERMQSSYDSAIDKAVLVYYLGKFSELPSDQRVALRDIFYDADIQTPESIQKFVDSLFSEDLVLDNSQRRVEMFTTATTEDLQQSRDSFIQLALKLRSFTKEQEQRDKRYEGKMALLRPIYIQACREYLGVPIAPDANGTLRVTFGTVKGYRPGPHAPFYAPFTTLRQVGRKHTGTGLFDVPAKFLEAADTVSDKTDFYDVTLQDVPVNFLSDLDITGGNSGSATLNQKGEWVGLVFDGNSEGVASNLLFMPESTRAIHVDLRYILWIMKYVDHADNLLYELGIYESL